MTVIVTRRMGKERWYVVKKETEKRERKGWEKEEESEEGISASTLIAFAFLKRSCILRWLHSFIQSFIVCDADLPLDS